MPHYDLASDDGLRAACSELSRPESWDESRIRWIAELSKVIASVRAADETGRAQYDFQHKLWEENWVAAPGQGTISVEQALRDADFRAWLAKRSVEALPTSREPRLPWLTDLYGNIQKRLRPFLTKKMPHLKIFRVLAALYPESFTTVADKGKLSILCKAMGVPRKLEPVERHFWVRERLDHVLGVAPTDPRSLADRMALAWMLYAKFVRAPDELVTEEASTVPWESRLIPLPAARRRRGLTSLRGGFPTVLSALEFIREGVSRPDLIAFLRSTLPGVKESTLGVVINVLQSELGVVRNDGGRYVLTDRGETVLESQDPDDLADWLLTHILGVDKAIVELRDRGPLPPQELAESIRTVNPGWTTVYAPNSIQNWLRTLGVIETSSDWKHQLTEEGKEWAARIHWKPEALPPEDDAAPLAGAAPAATQPVDPRVSLPPLSEIVQRVQAAGQFEPSTIAQLHAGLWAHPRRHFAILTGLSGSGKTLIAREYARAISSPSGPAQLFILAVQPGWYDPGALLGYVNPLRGDSYVRTPFLEFLLAASGDLQRPYTVVLDEMNLSHPEQYMAPLLSAMETGSRIDLHTEEDVFDGVPASVAYPANLVLIGTVNMDETTHGLSDKVLDRAFTLEFWDIDLAQYPRWKKRGIAQEQEAKTRAALDALMKALSPARLHFGWRVIDDVLDFLLMAASAAEALPFGAALDAAIYAKVIPKLRGEDSARFRDALESCEAALAEHGLERSRQKVRELTLDLETTGSARFWR